MYDTKGSSLRFLEVGDIGLGDIDDLRNLEGWLDEFAPTSSAAAEDADPTRCLATTLEYAGHGVPWQPTRCIYAAGHAADHYDGCVTWENDALPLDQHDEPRKRTPRPLTGWDLD